MRIAVEYETAEPINANEKKAAKRRYAAIVTAAWLTSSANFEEKATRTANAPAQTMILPAAETDAMTRHADEIIGADTVHDAMREITRWRIRPPFSAAKLLGRNAMAMKRDLPR